MDDFAFQPFFEMLDDAQVGFFILDCDFRVVWVSEKIEEFFGIERAALMGQDKRHVIKTRIEGIFEKSERFVTLVLATYDDNSYAEQFECHILPGAGRRERWLEHWSQPITSGPYAGGRIEQYTDITERKRAEQALAARTRQQAAVARLGQQALGSDDLQPLMEQAVQLIASVLDVEYAKVLELLPGGEEMALRAGVGWKPKYRVGEATVDTGMNSQAGYTLLSSEPVVVDELSRDSRFTGPPLLQEHNVVSGISVIIGPLVEPFGVLGTHTTRRRAFSVHEVDFVQAVANILGAAIERSGTETALRVSQQRLKAVINTAVDGIITITDDGSIEAVNPAAERIFGYAAEEMVGRNVNMLMPEPYASEHDCYLANYLRTGERKIIGTGREVEGLRRDGSIFPMELAVSEARMPGYRRFTGLVRDISERKQAEAERKRLVQALEQEQAALLELTDKLEEHVAERTAQVRQLASALSLAEERERRRIGQVLHDDVQQMLVALQIMVHRKACEAGAEGLFEEVDALLTQIFDVTRTLSAELSSPTLAHEALSDSLLWLVAYMAEYYDLRVALEVEGDHVIRNPELRVLAARLVRELLFNVVKHAGVDHATVSACKNGDGITIEIHDAGKGFDPATLKHSRKGTGFGLASMEDRLALYGGRLELESVPGEGTRVRLHIPTV